MVQTFKTVYLQDYPAIEASKKHIRLAFGEKESALLEKIRGMSSEDIRRAIGFSSYEDLRRFAAERALSINRACISLLHQHLGVIGNERLNAHNQWNSGQDRLIGTHRGAVGELFHDWYPLVEGYSSRFVDAVLDNYLPGANLILDPFGGCGSTPITVAMHGLTGFYCELNPVFQYICDTKVMVLQLDKRRRAELVGLLREEALGIRFLLEKYAPEEGLRQSYSRTFGNSRFFKEDTFLDILRLRTRADELNAEGPLLGRLFTIAVLASLVPTSLVKRAGDLRFRTEQELLKSLPQIVTEVSRRLNGIADDIETAELMVGQAVRLLEDARVLSRLPRIHVDGIITSPPYLNGTNYFRNTKLELWFLRGIRENADLAFFREKAVTAGINDVTNAKCGRPIPYEATEAVTRVAKNAYDNRIPMMVGRYFVDMEDVLLGLAKHLRVGGILAIDIGDSSYGGVHIETDNVLGKIAERLGFRRVAKHVLRSRKSRDGSVLRQVLLVMEMAGEPSKLLTTGNIANMLPDEWRSFKTDLPHQKEPYSKRNWGHGLHSLCSYQGKMKPSLAHFLVKTFVPEGGTILDPFAGVGTIPFEACLQGKKSYAFDISPAALAICAAKLAKPELASVEQLLTELELYLASAELEPREHDEAKLINFNRGLDEYYDPRTLDEILLARQFFKKKDKTDVNNAIVLACLLHILHGNRPYALSRRSHPITPFAPSGKTEYRALMPRLREKVKRSIMVEYPREYTTGVVMMQDAITWWPRNITDLDAVVTSPPFFDSTRFYLANWIRLWFCGWDKEQFKIEPLRYIETKQKESMRIYESVFQQARERLKNGGVVVMHLGRSAKCDMGEELKRIARPWFETSDLFEENVEHTESHGVTDTGKVTGHQYLILK